MSFFDDLPAPPERPRQPKFAVPPWAGPPSDELPAVVPLGRFLQRTPRMAMAAKSAEVYSTGCARNSSGRSAGGPTPTPSGVP